LSFFFSEKKRAPVSKRAAPAKPAQAGKASKEMLNRLGCQACPLNKAPNLSPKMEPDLAPEPGGIYFLGEGVSDDADEKNKPFAGSAGNLLNSLIGHADHYSYDNVVRDFSENNGSPVWVAMECCRTHVVTSIEKAKPKLIVGLGIAPLQWMLNSSDMIGLRGRVFAVKVGQHSCWFMPSYHPQFIIDNAYEGKEPLRSKLGHCLKFDMLRAKRLFKDLPLAEIDTPQAVRAGIQAFNGRGAGQLAQVLTLISEARKAPEKAIDWETYPLRPYAADAKLLTCAISFKSTNFAFAIDHPQGGWKPHEKEAIKKALREMLSDKTTIIAHNAPFEIEWAIYLLGREVIFHDVWECTMMQSHFLDERRGKRGGNDEQFQPNPYQALDFLVKQHFGISFKELFKVNRKRMDKADLDETLLYNGADTKYTLRLFHNQSERLKFEGLRSAYQEAIGRQPAVALMQSLGISLSQEVNQEFAEKLDAEIKTVEKRIREVAEVKDFVTRYKTFNVGSQPEVIRLFKENFKLGKELITAEGKVSVDKATLQKIKHPIAKDIEEWRNRSKLKSTYVDPFTLGTGQFIWPDKKIHPSFNTTFAETGRTSSDEPNQQNWPSRNDKWVRRQIVAPKGHLLVAFDYGQLEGCTGAMCSRDKTFVKALWEDYDMHMEWAQRAAALWPAYIGGEHMRSDKKAMKDFRGLIKNKLVFPAFFGAAKESIAGYLTVATDVEAPKHVIEKLFNEFWRAFSGVANWQKRLMDDYYNTGFVESPTGRRRHYPLGRPQAINYPIQSVACDIVCRAMVRLSADAADTGKWYLHPIMNIHDDLTFCIPDDPRILEEAIEHIYKVMLTPSYDFINVPLSVSASVGTNWLDMDEIGKFWSHRDV
jgi:uracil-DNA glycosylase family 4